VKKDFTMGSVRRIAKQIVDLSDEKRKNVLSSMVSDMRCKVVEEMVNIKIQRGRDRNET
jgi:hypothetical protein